MISYKLLLLHLKRNLSVKNILNDGDRCAAIQADIVYCKFCHNTPFNLGFRRDNGMQYLTNTIRNVIFYLFSLIYISLYFIIVHLYVRIFYVALIVAALQLSVAVR